MGSGSRFDPLGEFIGNHPEPTREPLAVVLYERAQLLAGPLERVEEAIACRSHGKLRHALLSLSADPEDMKAGPLSENESISDRVRNNNSARSLLATVVQAWISQIGRR